MLTEEGLDYIEAYKFYKNGILPASGGWMEQSQAFFDAMRIIEIEYIKLDKEKKKQLKEDNING